MIFSGMNSTHLFDPIGEKRNCYRSLSFSEFKLLKKKADICLQINSNGKLLSKSKFDQKRFFAGMVSRNARLFVSGGVMQRHF